MFRLSDYDFEYGEKDYVAFMAVFKKFLDLCHELNEPMKGHFTEAEMVDHAENYALDYVTMRTEGIVSMSLVEFLNECVEYLDYNVNVYHITEVDDLDDMLWNVYSDLCE